MPDAALARSCANSGVLVFACLLLLDGTDRLSIGGMERTREREKIDQYLLLEDISIV